jgi:hypothetical protein
LSEPAASRRLPGRLRPALRAAPATAAMAAIGLIAWGQYAVSQSAAPFDWPLTGWLDARLTSAFNAPNDLAFAIPLFIAGGVIFALAVPGVPLPSDDVPSARERRSPLLRAIVAAFAVGVALWGWLVFHLARGDYEPAYRWIFLISLLLPLAALAAHDLRGLRAGGRRVLPQLRLSHAGEIIVLAGIVATFVALNARDLENWRFAAIGDEGRFYMLGVRMLDDPALNWFNHDDGPFKVQPVLGSGWHTLNMAIFGRDLFGWKMGALTAIAFTLPALYWLLREAIGVRVAIFGAMFLGASHYLFAYAHTGYNNVFPLFPTVSALALLVSGLKRGSYALLFLSGVMAGLGCYTYFSSRAAIVIVAVALITLAPRLRHAIGGVALGALGFAMTIAPLFAVERWSVVSKTFERSAFDKDTSLWEHLAGNAPRSLLAFNFNPNNLHYTAGALADEITAVLAVAGLVLCLLRLRVFAYRLLAAWFAIALAVTGLFSEYDVVTISRLHYALPPVAAFAAIALDRAIAAAGEIGRRPRLEWIFAAGAFAVLAPALFVVNSRHFRIYSAEHNPTIAETVIIRALARDACEAQPLRSVAYMRAPDSVLYGTLAFFDEAERPLIFAFADNPFVYHPFPDSGGAGCLAMAEADHPSVVPFIGRWRAGAGRGGYEVTTVTDRTGQARVEAVVPPDAGPGIDAAAIAANWRTRTDLGEGIDGIVQGQNKDGIIGMETLTFAPVERATVFIDEPLVVVNIAGDRRAYPQRVLAWHVVINDVVGGVPVAVTFDPIAGAARVYDRGLPDGRLLTFAVSGLLRDGNSLLFDRETETWWRQLTGEGLTGELHERQLQPVPFTVVATEEYRRAYPRAPVLNAPDGTPIRYRLNPYLGYDTPGAKPIYTRAEADVRLPAMQRVAVIEIGGRLAAIPYPDDGLVRAYHLEREGERVVLFYDALARSPLEGRDIPASRSIGSFTAFRPLTADGRALTFTDQGRLDPIFETDAGAQYDVFGRGEGNQLAPVMVGEGFWFSVSAVYPAIEIVELPRQDSQ